MSKKNFKAGKYRLIVIAHPDDETLFMGGLVLSQRDLPWKVICVTDGNGDGHHKKRKRDFEKACKMLGAKACEMWDFPDKYGKRLNIDEIVERLLEFEVPAEIYTHGIVGEYGHPHHQDVSFATHRAFHRKASVWSIAYNSPADRTIVLEKKAFSRKAKVLAEVYGSETQRFAHLIPATSSEGFVRVPFREVEMIYSFLVEGKRVAHEKIKVYRHYWPQFKKRFAKIPSRLF